MRLQGKVALITGASRGIGRSIAQLFAKEGAKVVINYHKSKKEALSLAKELQKQNNKVLLIKANVSKSDEVKNMVKKTVDEFGQLDILVNNAGILIPTTLLNSTEEMWDKIIDINLKGAYLCSKEVGPIMLNQKKGKIINIASISGLGERTDPKRIKIAIEESIIKRIAKPEEIAKAALFLASNDSDFITGEVLTLAGGKGMR